MADEDLPPSYVKKCQIFLRKIKEFKKATGSKPQASSAQKQTQLKSRIKI